MRVLCGFDCAWSSAGPFGGGGASACPRRRWLQTAIDGVCGAIGVLIVIGVGRLMRRRWLHRGGGGGTAAVPRPLPNWKSKTRYLNRNFDGCEEKSNILKAQFITDPKDHAEKRGEQYTVALPHPRLVGCGPWSLTKDCGRPRR